MKRLLSLCLVCLLLIGGLPTVWAAEMTVGRQEAPLLQQGAFPAAATGSVRTLRAAARTAAVSGNTAADRILTGLDRVEASIDLSDCSLTPAELKTLYPKVINGHPELFYVSGGYGYSYSGDYVVAVYPDYEGTAAEIASQKETYEARLTDILDLVRDEWTDYEKALYVHDYLAENFCYDESYSIYDAYGFLTQKTGVCQAYTLTYMAVLQALGIPVTSVCSDAMNHTWNVVELDGVWYHVDVTWDDPVGARYGYVGHSNFMADDAGIADTKHYDWYYTDTVRTCPQVHEQYARLKAVQTPVVELDGIWYYADSAETGYALYGTDWTNTATVQALTERWPVIGQAGYVWSGCFAGLGTMGDMLVYNTPGVVYGLNPTTGTKTSLVTVSTAASALYGLRFGLDGFFYATQVSPNDATPAGVYALPYTHSHRFARYVDTAAATCGADAVQTSRCAYCGVTTTRTVAGERPAHTYDEGVVTKEATCVDAGEKTFTCAVCGETATEELPALGHNWSAEWTVDVEPTATYAQLTMVDGSKKIVNFYKKGTIVDGVPYALDADTGVATAAICGAYLYTYSEGEKGYRHVVQITAAGDFQYSYTMGSSIAEAISIGHFKDEAAAQKDIANHPDRWFTVDGVYYLDLAGDGFSGTIRSLTADTITLEADGTLRKGLVLGYRYDEAAQTLIITSEQPEYDSGLGEKALGKEFAKQ